MRSVLLAFSILFPSLAGAVDTYTTNLGLVKPTIGSLNWGPKINSDMDVIDTEIFARLKTTGGTMTGTLTVSSHVVVAGTLSVSSASFATLNVSTLSVTGSLVGSGAGLFGIPQTGVVGNGSFPTAGSSLNADLIYISTRAGFAYYETLGSTMSMVETFVNEVTDLYAYDAQLNVSTTSLQNQVDALSLSTSSLQGQVDSLAASTAALSGNLITALNSDGSIDISNPVGVGVATVTLPVQAITPGTFGGASESVILTVNDRGIVTGFSSATISGYVLPSTITLSGQLVANGGGPSDYSVVASSSISVGPGGIWFDDGTVLVSTAGLGGSGLALVSESGSTVTIVGGLLINPPSGENLELAYGSGACFIFEDGSKQCTSASEGGGGSGPGGGDIGAGVISIVAGSGVSVSGSTGTVVITATGGGNVIKSSQTADYLVKWSTATNEVVNSLISSAVSSATVNGDLYVTGVSTFTGSVYANKTGAYSIETSSGVKLGGGSGVGCLTYGDGSVQCAAVTPGGFTQKSLVQLKADTPASNGTIVQGTFHPYDLWVGTAASAGSWFNMRTGAGPWD